MIGDIGSILALNDNYDGTFMFFFRVINLLFALSMIRLCREGMSIIRNRQLTTKMKLTGKTRIIIGREAVQIGRFYIAMGVVGAITSAIGAVADVNFFGIPINFFTGVLLCSAPFMLPLILVNFVERIRDKKKDTISIR
jgi:hypothetical protein